MIYARLSLGRSIGYVPADRGIITSGPYRFVRHPIYSGLFVTLFAFLLRAYLPLNLPLEALIVGLFMLQRCAMRSCSNLIRPPRGATGTRSKDAAGSRRAAASLEFLGGASAVRKTRFSRRRRDTESSNFVLTLLHDFEVFACRGG
jgi:protein-S-isoprenylcysteine O-methyltransferase Ste14